MPFPAFITRKFSSRSSGNEEEGQELDDRNASPTQTARSQEIIAEITAGTAICTICTDPVAFGHGAIYNIWHCKECYNVYHYTCAKSWEQQSLQNRAFAWLGIPAWRCPTCSTPQTAIRGAYCWCGKQEHLLSRIGSPNACENVCARVGKCAHNLDRSCVVMCHPGPCKYPCTNECPRGPIAPPRPPNAWDRMCMRARGRTKGSFRMMALGWGAIASIYSLLGALLYFHIRWHTMPYIYPDFNSSWEKLGIYFGGLFIVSPVTVFILLSLYTTTADFLASALNLQTGPPFIGFKPLFRIFGAILLAAFFFGIYVLPMIGFIEGPDIGWYHQMKDSCNGFDTRIDMDQHFRGTRRFAMRTIQDKNDDKLAFLFLGRHLKPTPEPSNATFQYYSRLSGFVAGISVAVDVDMENNVWRFIRLSDSDPVNEWLAYKSNILYDNGNLPKLPELDLPAETILRKGTFSRPTWEQTYVEIPQLDMVIMDMQEFLSDYKLEPFLRVFTYRDFEMAGAEQERIEYDSVGKETPVWTREPHLQEVMRTAAFGHGRTSLTMCVREYTGYQHMKPVAPVVSGMQQTEMIPFAIITAMRQRYIETGKRASTYP